MHHCKHFFQFPPLSFVDNMQQGLSTPDSGHVDPMENGSYTVPYSACILLVCACNALVYLSYTLGV